MTTKTKNTFFAAAVTVLLTAMLMLLIVTGDAPAGESYEVSLDSPTPFPVDI